MIFQHLRQFLIFGVFLLPSSKLAEEHAFGSTITNNGSRALFPFWVKKAWKIHDFAIFKAIS